MTRLTLTVLAASLQLGSAAEITGKVKLSGTPRPDIKINFADSTDKFCGKVHENDSKRATTSHFVVVPNKELANVFVYIKEGARKTPATGENPLLDQNGCLYAPYVVGVVTDQPLRIRNSDPTMHNVHGMPLNNPEFNFAQFVKGQENPKVFKNPEVLVRMKCDVHGWMFPNVAVADHPYFSLTQKEGSSKTSNLPAGTYTIEAFHPKLAKPGAKSQKITVGDGDKKTVDFELVVPPAP